VIVLRFCKSEKTMSQRGRAARARAPSGKREAKPRMWWLRASRNKESRRSNNIRVRIKLGRRRDLRDGKSMGLGFAPTEFLTEEGTGNRSCNW
jgi:hypothetical protein